jgi:hypothetical protein
MREKTHKTDYLAPVSLWLVIRDHPGNVIEAAATGCGSHDHGQGVDCGSGPILFTSRIHAEVYAHVRNTYHLEGDTDGWRVVSLLDYNLREHVRVRGGTLRCMIAFGFSTNESGALLVKFGSLSVLNTMETFSIDNEETGKIVFSFVKPLEPVLAEWAAMGLHAFNDELRELDSRDEAGIAQAVTHAIAQTGIEHAGFASRSWGVYCPVRARWFVAEGFKVFASEQPQTLH